MRPVVLRASWAYVTWGYNHHHSSSRIYLCSNMNVSQGIHSIRRDLILEPLAGSCYHESDFRAGNLMASCTPQESHGTLHHTVGFWPCMASHVAANLQICKEAKGRKCRPKGQRHKGRPQGRLPSTPPSFIASQSQTERAVNGTVSV